MKKRICKKIVAVAMATVMLISSGNTAYAIQREKSCYGTVDYTDVLTSTYMKLMAKSWKGEQGRADLQLKDPYIWHNWRTVEFKTVSGKTTRYKYAEAYDGSSKAKWRGKGDNVFVRIHY